MLSLFDHTRVGKSHYTGRQACRRGNSCNGCRSDGRLRHIHRKHVKCRTKSGYTQSSLAVGFALQLSLSHFRNFSKENPLSHRPRGDLFYITGISYKNYSPRYFCISFTSTCTNLILCLTDIAAATPAASPIAMQTDIILKFECAR